MKKISAIIACYKDEEAIPVMYRRLAVALKKLPVGYEIIFVNDGSPDNSEAVLSNVAKKDKRVIVINHSRNFGSQMAFTSGMEIATGDAVVLLDGDLQDPPELIVQFFKKWQSGFDVVYGIRTKREGSRLINLAYKLFYRLFSKLSYIKVPVDAGDFSLIDKKVVRVLNSMPERDRFLRGLRAWAGFRQTGVSYVRKKRMFGQSTNNWHKNLGWARKGIFSFSYIPLEFITYFSLVIVFFSFFGIVYQVLRQLFFPNAPHGVSTIIVLVLFLGGVQLLSLSVLGEYIGKIFEEVKGRPRYIVKSILNKPKKL